jgi:hypothetical protein
MIDTLKEFTITILDPVGVWIGIATAVPIFWLWIDHLVGRRRQHRKWLAQLRQSVGVQPAVLIVDLLPGKDVTAAVERHLAEHESLRSIDRKRIFKVVREKTLRPEDSAELVRDIQNIAGEILRSGADVLHYFHAGPVFAAALVGAEFANAGCKMLLYQNEQGRYTNFGPLRHPRF